MSTMKSAVLRGAAIGAAVCLPLGVGAGILLVRVIAPEQTLAHPWPVVMLTTVSFVAWGAFIGAMFKAEATKEER